MSNEPPSTNQHPRLLSFALDDWDVLGGRVEVTLTDGVAVLVGRNGAGKSAILEGLESISALVSGRPSGLAKYGNDVSFPGVLEIEVLTPTGRHLQYRYELIDLETLTDELRLGSSVDFLINSRFSWNDICQYLDEPKETIWSTENGTIRSNHVEFPTIIGGVSPFANLPERVRKSLPDETQWLRNVLMRVRLLNEFPVRRKLGRHPSRLDISSKGFLYRKPLSASDNLVVKIYQILQEDPDGLDEFEAICKRLGIGGKVTTKKFLPSGEDATENDHIFSVSLDGVDFGLLSDGTLKVLDILLGIMDLSSGSTVMIEEPEAQIHPGLLSKLLPELEAYTYGENLVISTQSPQVVSWTDPNKINLVHRENGRTYVRKLGEAEIRQVVEYLDEEGDLGEWIYNGILDE